jgi:hypothetical protein
MIIALYCLAVFALVSGVTVFALATAKDGYEDRFGFHDASTAHPMPEAEDAAPNSRGPIPPFAAAG